MKLSPKKVLAAKVQRPAAPTQGKALVDRAVNRMVIGLNAARQSGKFPKVY